MNSVSYIDSICSLVADIPHTAISTAWTWIFYAFSSYWYLIVPALILWVIFEIFSRGNHDFNSDNGFTPIFNSFVGGGIFLLTGTLIDWLLHLVIGPGISCGLLWVRSFYLIPFVSTGLLLHGIGFWPYWRLPFTREKIDLFGRGKKYRTRPRQVRD